MFAVTQDFHELLKKTVRANTNFLHIFEPIENKNIWELYETNANNHETLGNN